MNGEKEKEKKYFKISIDEALKISGIIIKIQLNLKNNQKNYSSLNPEEILSTLEEIEQSIRHKEGCLIDPKKIIKILNENKETPQLIKIDGAE